MIGTPQLLITDDDRDFRETLAMVFERKGFSTMLAADGLEAVQIVRQQSIHLVLIDFQMPRLSGLDAICRIKQINEVMPCILISGALDGQIRSRAEACAFSILDKPVTKQDLTRTVDLALRDTYGRYDHAEPC